MTWRRNLTAKGNLSSFLTETVVDGKSAIIQTLARTRNVVMLLPGEDASLKNEYIVFGGHFDHLGMGGPGSSSRAVDTIAVHHGADDNASGVALMIELAGKFAGTKNSHKRSLIFMAFTGEEEGLLGSKYFTDNPVTDLSKVDFMVNFDMVGRLKETRSLQIGGVGTAAGLQEKAVAAADTNAIKAYIHRRRFRTIGPFRILFKEYSCTLLYNRIT